MVYADSTTNSTEPAADAITAIEAALTTHAGWTFIEQHDFTQGGTAKRARVWKCLGSQNNAGQDFHIALVKPTAAGQTTFNVRLFEGYNATAHTVIRPAPHPSGTNMAVSAVDYSIGNGTEYAMTLASGAGWQADALVGSFTVSVNTDHFIVVGKSFLAYTANCTSLVQAGGFYVGNFVPSYSTSYNPVMSWIVNTAVASGASGNATRFPGYTATASSTTTDVNVVPATYPQGYVSGANVVAERFLNRTEAAGCLVVTPQLTAGSPATNLGGVRGTLPTSVAVMLIENNVPRNGDFVTIGGVEYMRVGGNNSVSFSSMSASKGIWVSKSVDW